MQMGTIFMTKIRKVANKRTCLYKIQPDKQTNRCSYSDPKSTIIRHTRVDMLIQFALVQVKDRLQLNFQLDGAPPHQGHWELWVCIEITFFWHFIFFGGNGKPINLLSQIDDQSPDFYIFEINKNQTCVASIHKIQNGFTSNHFSVVPT